ncbi:hypothetical protein PsorP6_007521 [Peronosclerospora sorghi]|uniref:Uncharacterized protein n=1 Tax=Peronosclerospora sorghi TaxID=230839 RepID=A0ACC0WD67_9STRA|nr:hypothetical protein PsorP6_007521 [Peronosclerospora sorghi]
MSLSVKHIFEACIQTQLYPRSQIHIFVQLLHADGGELPAVLAPSLWRLYMEVLPLMTLWWHPPLLELCRGSSTCTSASHRAKPAHEKAQYVANEVQTTAGIIRKSYGGGY